MNTLTKTLVLAGMIALNSSVALAAEGTGGAGRVRVDTESKKGFKQTVEAVEKAVKSRGMMVVAKIDHQNMLTMVGVKIGGSTTIEFGKPDMGKMVLTMAPEAGLEMPGKIYVFEKEGKTLISYYKSNFVNYSPDFTNVDEMMGMMVAEIVKEAAQ